MRLLVATNNQGKLNEYSQILSSIEIEVASLKQQGLDIEVVEDGETFEENAVKKAVLVCKASGEVSLADDSGLEVDYLNGRPGVYSARFSDPDATPQKNNQLLLDLLKDIPKKKRTARFVCVIAVAFPDGKVITSRGECEGVILDEMRGDEGFGYDPLFYYPPLNKTFAQLGKDEKNKVSHRGKAMEKMMKKLKELVKARSVEMIK